MLIRSAQEKDLPQLVAFQLAMALETENLQLDPAVLTQGMQAVLSDANKGAYFVAEMEGKVVGSLMITYEWSDWRNGMVWWIQSVFVDKDFRGKGVYKALYTHIQDLVKADEKIRGIRLYVDKTNTSAQAVYKKLGMNGEHYATFEWMKFF
ncbi:GNAT family N-acetyltransferase [Cytophagales bacterium LB-30]|uniref:GNAT family N-acetyltransferase n=1 Tax=Shiella aurantiaca TaxID=3058365 RepID=A0ABT8F5Q5_9BACT|nr:GNAT family N-acetyltransferase [Shiella aurantiaca]MDN4165633.1 GNAT family N-acetyltransferase [Shiella aurantiaca]